MKSRFLDLAPSGARIQVVEAGKSGPDLLYLHGAGGHMRDDPLIAALAKKHRVRAPLLPGYGESTGEEGLRDMLDVTLHCLDVMEALELDDPIVVGHSMGGMIAAEMAAVARNDIDRLCLIAPAGLWLDAHPIPDLFALLPQEFPGWLFHDVERGRAMMAPGGDLSDLKFLADFMVTNARRFGMAGKLLFPIPDRGLAQRLHRIRAKTLLVWGRQDRLIPPVYADAFAAGIAKARLAWIDEAGHAAGHEQPDAVAKAIRKAF